MGVEGVDAVDFRPRFEFPKKAEVVARSVTRVTNTH